MPIKALRAWLGVEQPAAAEHAPLRELIESLDQLEIGQAKHLARFAYLLGRIACADRDVSADETAIMERLVAEHGRLSGEQSVLVVGMAKSSNLMFGGTADFAVTKEFTEHSTYEEKLALARCLFAVAATDDAISLAEEAEIHRIVNQLRILPEDLMQLRVEHRDFLPGIKRANAKP
jgi:uncharacterized tellurite resistance protein B-like protein